MWFVSKRSQTLLIFQCCSFYPGIVVSFLLLFFHSILLTNTRGLVPKEWARCQTDCADREEHPQPYEVTWWCLVWLCCCVSSDHALVGHKYLAPSLCSDTVNSCTFYCARLFWMVKLLQFFCCGELLSFACSFLWRISIYVMMLKLKSDPAHSHDLLYLLLYMLPLWQKHICSVYHYNKHILCFNKILFMV